MKMLRKSLFPAVMSLALAVSFSSACGKKSGSKDGSNANASPASTGKQPQTPFERDLDYVRKGQFTYVFVFSRKDGAAFDKDDISYLKSNSPTETNQWISTDDGRRVIAGTNFEFKPEHFDALQQRFNIEDYTGK